MEASRKVLTNGLSELGINFADSTLLHFATYLSELKKWNRAYNLTSITEDREIIVKHFFDSLLYLEAIPQGRCSVADVGSGAGFPGVPLALVRPDLTVTLIEASRKKAAFLMHIRSILSLRNLDVIESRVELVRDRQFDVVLTRALYTIAELRRKAGHLLAQGGYFVLSKGPKAQDEMKELPGDIQAAVQEVRLPGTDLKRNIITVRLVR